MLNATQHSNNPSNPTTDSGLSLWQQGFTLIEMIGILAVVAALSAPILSKVFEAIAE